MKMLRKKSVILLLGIGIRCDNYIKVNIMKRHAKGVNKLTNIYQNIGQYGLVIFCFAMLYSYLTVVGVVGYMPLSYIYMVLTICLGIIFLANINNGITIHRLFVWILIIWISVLHFIWFFPIVSQGGTIDFYRTAANTLLLSMFMLMLGESIGLNINIYGIYSSKNIFLIGYMILIVTTIFGIYVGYDSYGRLIMYFRNYETGYSFNYLIFSDLLAILGLLLMQSIKTFHNKFLFYIITCVFLSFSYSRTSFYLFIICGALLLSSYLCIKRRIILTVFLIVICITILVPLIAVINHIYSQLPIVLQRMLILITNPLEDESLRSRIALLWQGLPMLRKNVLLGSFMSEWWYSGATGGYVHNWLSFLISYGIGPFLLFLIIDIMLLYRSYVISRRSNIKVHYYVLLYCNFAIIISRSYVWPMIWFALGLCACIGVKSRRKEKSTLLNENCISFSLKQAK